MSENTIEMFYGDYQIIPVPFINLTKQYNQATDGTHLGTTFAMSLDGTLTQIPTGFIGLSGILEIQQDLREAFATEGKVLKVTCDDEIILNVNPRINSLSFLPSNNNWVMTSPYSIELEFDDVPTNTGEDPTLMPHYIRDASETWDVEISEDNNFHTWVISGGTTDILPYIVRVTHEISAVGKRHYFDDGTLRNEAWQEAKEYVVPKLGLDTSRLTDTGVLNLSLGTMGLTDINHTRVVNTDELGGQYSVTETWLLIDDNAGAFVSPAIEDFTINMQRSLNEAFTNFTIEGEIQGLQKTDFGLGPALFLVEDSKFFNASGHWKNIVEKRLYNRVRTAASSASGVTEALLNPEPLERTVAYSPGQGLVTYSYLYNDRPCNFIENALVENIVINDNKPTDIIASITVLGRARGPILQDLSTPTASTRSISIEAIVAPPTGCNSGTLATVQEAISGRPNITQLLCMFEQDLTTGYDSVFKQEDQESWNPKTGQFSRNVTWVYVNCTGDPPITSFCP